MTETTIEPSSRWSPLWLLPIAALITGLWMAGQSYLQAGPTVTVTFDSAQGIEAGKTKVKLLSVDVGYVESIQLDDGGANVRVTLTLDRSVTSFLREDTQFWVVRARVGASGISGIGTLLSGGYIEFSPGEGSPGRRRFQGLEDPPLTAPGAAGLRVELVSDRAALSVGDPVHYQGFRAGRVEAVRFDQERRLAVYQVFIDAPYDEQVVSSTRFWDTSGISLQASAAGFELNVGALESILLGGISFATPSELPPGRPIDSGYEFVLYGSYSDILKSPYRYGKHYVALFDQPLGGLVPGAPVTFRGIRIGSVERILLSEFTSLGVYQADQPIPVLMYLEPGRLEVPDSPESVEEMTDALEYSVSRGLRATLQVGNLLTGMQQIALDFYPNAPEASAGMFNDYQVLPTIETGVARIGQQVTSLMATLNELPLKRTVETAATALASANELLAKLSSSAASLDTLLADDQLQQLVPALVSSIEQLNRVMDGYAPDATVYQNLNGTLAQLNETVSNLNALTATLAEQPNALIFSAKQAVDPIPKASP
ncbi:MAG: intermembrane transport protein PqiB [Pseudomonadota bacterium]